MFFLPRKKWKIEDFNLGRALGKGRFGNVYLAKEKKTNYVVALKIMFKKDIRDNELQHQVLFLKNSCFSNSYHSTGNNLTV